MTKRVSIINFKGGVGKTTVAFQIGCLLTTIEKSRVLLVDVDHQSSLSITCLGGADWSSAVNSNTTIDEVFKHMTVLGAPIPGSSIIHHPGLPLSTKYSRLYIVPAALSLDETEIELTGSVTGDPIMSDWNKRTLICEWLQSNRVDESYDYVLFDCPPATKIVTQNALAASHSYIVPVIPDAVSIRGTPHLTNQMMGKIESKFNSLSLYLRSTHKLIVGTFVPKRKFAGIVVSRVRTTGGYSGYANDPTQHLASLERIYNHGEIMKPILEEGVGVSESNTKRLPVGEFENTQNIGKRGFPEMFKQLTIEFKRRIDSGVDYV